MSAAPFQLQETFGGLKRPPASVEGAVPTSSRVGWDKQAGGKLFWPRQTLFCYGKDPGKEPAGVTAQLALLLSTQKSIQSRIP